MRVQEFTDNLHTENHVSTKKKTDVTESTKQTPEKELERLGLRQNAQKKAPLRDQAATQARIRELEKQIADKKKSMAEN
jgi:transcription elongation GreA/GreB family factor